MNGRRFKLVLEDDSGSGRHTEELYEAPTIEEIREFVNGKAGSGGEW